MRGRRSEPGHHALAVRGDVTLPQDTDKIWTTPGGRIAWFRDPDGNVLSLTEFTGN